MSFSILNVLLRQIFLLFILSLSFYSNSHAVENTDAPKTAFYVKCVEWSVEGHRANAVPVVIDWAVTIASLVTDAFAPGVGTAVSVLMKKIVDDETGSSSGEYSVSQNCSIQTSVSGEEASYSYYYPSGYSFCGATTSISSINGTRNPVIDIGATESYLGAYTWVPNVRPGEAGSWITGVTQLLLVRNEYHDELVKLGICYPPGYHYKQEGKSILENTYNPVLIVKKNVTGSVNASAINIKSIDNLIACGTKCSSAYSPGTQVILTIDSLPANNSVTWTGCISVVGDSCVVKMDKTTVVTAKIINPTDSASAVLSAITQLLLDDDASPPACTLAASPSTINAGGSSTLTATCTPAATSYAWSDSTCDKAKNTCTVTPAATTPYTVAGTNADGTGAVTSATVTVTPASLYALGVSNSGTGYGNVASSPVGIACYAPQPGVNYLVAPDCSESYASGTSVTLTATPASGSTFTGWSGACTGTGSCTVSMTEAKSVTATFAQSVTAPDCTLSANPSSITAGESSTLTATCKPTPTSYIWTGGTCAGSGSTCTVTPTATTTYTVQGANSGGTKPAVSVTVTVAPNSPPVCTLTANPASVSSGGNSTLTATCTPAATSYTWTGGSCAGTTGSICMVNPTAATTYTVKGSNAVGTGAAASITVSVSQQNKCDVAPVSRPAGSIVTGTAINESFSSSPGNDRIDGAGGIDTVIFGCNRANYTITQTTTGWTVQSDAEGLDILTNIERLRFADKTLALDIASEAGKNAGKSYRIYQAAFDRTPDAGGLKFWVGKMDDGMDMVEVSARFIDSDEFRAMYGTNPTDEVFVTLLYQHVLHRKPDQGGLDYWVDQLKRGLKTRPKVLADFSESTENQANVWETIKNGIELLN